MDEWRYDEVEGTGRHPSILPRLRGRPRGPSTGSRPCPSRARRRSSAPHRRPSRARPPPTRSRSDRRPRCAGPPPAGWPRRRRPTVSPCTSIEAKASPSTSARPSKPASATSRLEPRPTTRTGTALGPHRLGHRGQLVLAVHRDGQRRGTAHPVGGERAQRHVVSGQVAQQPGRQGDGLAVARPGRSRLSQSRPAPRRAAWSGRRPPASGRGHPVAAGGPGSRSTHRAAGQVGQGAPRVGVEHGVGHQLARDARAGRLARGVHVGDHQQVGRAEGVGEVAPQGLRCGCSGGAGRRTPPGPSSPGGRRTARRPPRWAGGRSRRRT